MDAKKCTSDLSPSPKLTKLKKSNRRAMCHVTCVRAEGKERIKNFVTFSAFRSRGSRLFHAVVSKTLLKGRRLIFSALLIAHAEKSVGFSWKSLFINHKYKKTRNWKCSTLVRRSFFYCIFNIQFLPPYDEGGGSDTPLPLYAWNRNFK